jgi:hypothetical protein
VTELVKRYRRNAEKCLQLVQSFNDPEAKRALLAMATAWLMLAAQREKNIETASPPSEPPVNERPVNEPPVNKAPPLLDQPTTPPPAGEPPQLRLNPAEPDDPMQC